MTVRKYIRYRLHRLSTNRLSRLPLPRRASSGAHALRTVRRAFESRAAAKLRCASLLVGAHAGSPAKHHPSSQLRAHEFQFSCSGDSEAAADAVFGFLVYFYFFGGFQFEEVVTRSIWSTSSPS